LIRGDWVERVRIVAVLALALGAGRLGSSSLPVMAHPGAACPCPVDKVDAVDRDRLPGIQFAALRPLPDRLLTHHVTLRGSEPLQLPKAERPLSAVIDAKSLCPVRLNPASDRGESPGAAGSVDECAGMTVAKPGAVVHLAAWIMDASHD